MSKRFSDTEKWERPWWRKLPTAYRWLWLYVLDRCDNAGIWNVDLELASFMIGEPLNAEDAQEFLSKQIEVLDGGNKWFIVDFVRFQYGTLTSDCHPHKKVIETLKEYKLLSRVPYRVVGRVVGRVRGTLQDKDKDKDKDKEKEGGVQGGISTNGQDRAKTMTDIQKMVCAFKNLQGYDENDKAWDKLNFRRCAGAAKKLIDFFGYWVPAMDCMQEIYERFTAKGLTVTMETVIKHAAEWKKDHQEKLQKEVV